ncbi:hypothetical protein ACH4ZU_33945 [Streptomyces sp. NPDC020472]|uniref:hypothetical protein n=1 Tax=Streptomyces sp. NPDC020472 TaxID=3365075 RepID=UPI0037A5F7DE
MIITPTRHSDDTHAIDAWVSLARKGMLWSEVQVVDVTVLGPGGKGPFLDPECLEALYCSRGIASFGDGNTPAVTLLAGQFLLVRPGDEPVQARAGGAGAELLRVRVLSPEVTRTLPRRRPSLGEPPAPGETDTPA